MLLKSVLAALCAIACVAAAPAPAPAPSTGVELRCASEPSSDDVSRVEADYTRQFNNFNKTDDRTTGGIWWLPWPKFWLKPIPVRWHVIRSGPTQAQGMILMPQINTQIARLNQAFAPFGFKFYFAGVDYTTNPTWFTYAGPGNAYQDALKKKLHIGGRGTLNVYSTGFLQIPPPNQYLGGYATWPWNAASRLWDDGIMIKYNTVPGGSLTGWNTGRVLVHEVGHWAGLYHTFQNGCSTAGDYVFDTPAEASPAKGCPTGRNSCPGLPGLDPIHNHMDYTVDSCRTNFTPGQRSRARAAVINYRGIN